MLLTFEGEVILKSKLIESVVDERIEEEGG